MDVFLIEDDDLLENYNSIWGKVSTGIKKNFIARLSIIKKNLKTKVKSQNKNLSSSN